MRSSYRRRNTSAVVFRDSTDGEASAGEIARKCDRATGKLGQPQCSRLVFRKWLVLVLNSTAGVGEAVYLALISYLITDK